MKKRNKISKFTEETVLALFARHLDELKWKYHRIADQPTLFGGFSGDRLRWDFNMSARELRPALFQLGVNTFIPNIVPPPQRPAVLELLTWINFELSLGCFEINLKSGEIRFRTSIVLPGADITPGIVEHLVRSNLCIVDARYSQITAVLYAGVTPEEALKPKSEQTESGHRFELN